MLTSPIFFLCTSRTNWDTTKWSFECPVPRVPRPSLPLAPRLRPPPLRARLQRAGRRPRNGQPAAAAARLGGIGGKTWGFYGKNGESMGKFGEVNARLSILLMHTVGTRWCSIVSKVGANKFNITMVYR